MAYPIEERIRLSAAIGLMVAQGATILAACQFHEICPDSYRRWRKDEPSVLAAFNDPKIWLKWIAAEVHTPGSWRMKIQTRGPAADRQSAPPR